MNEHIEQCLRAKRLADEQMARNAWIPWGEVVDILGADLARVLREQIEYRRIDGEPCWNLAMVLMWAGE